MHSLVIYHIINKSTDSSKKKMSTQKSLVSLCAASAPSLKFSNTSDELGKVLKPFFENDVIKTACLSLHHTIMCRRFRPKSPTPLMMMSQQSNPLKSTSTDFSKALAAMTSGSLRASGSSPSSLSSNNPRLGKSGPPKPIQCSGCKSRSLPYIGHVFESAPH